MRAYAIRRLILVIPTLFIVITLLFVLVRLVPGDILDLIYVQHMEDVLVDVYEEWDRDMLAKQLGLDVPIYVQYGRWLKDLFTEGTLGVSLWTGRTLMEELRPRMAVTAELNILGYLLGVPLALFLGLLSGIRQDTFGDYFIRIYAIASMSIPFFWIGTMVIVFPAIWWGRMIPIRYIPFVENPLGNLGQFLIPALVGAVLINGFLVRMTRTLVLEVLRQDYVRTAWSKGLKERVVILRHVLKNAFIPIITMIGNIFPIMLGGSVIVEQMFALPGVGRYGLRATVDRDYPIVVGLVFIVSILVMVNYVAVDLTYAWLDPRIRYK